MKTLIKEINIYKFDELSDEAKEHAIEKLYDLNLYYDWWDYITDDAKDIGLTLIEFDIDRGYIDLEFHEEPKEVAYLIIKNHGKQCETYKDAVNYLVERHSIKKKIVKPIDYTYEENRDDFLKELSGSYLNLLRSQYEYLTSEEAIIETIESMDYDFTEDGELY